MHDKLLRTDEVAVILDIPADRVATMAREGLLPAIRCGRSWRFAPSRLRKWMESGGAGGWKRSLQSEGRPVPDRWSGYER
jgi:excisionase family DNA binding protein